MAQDLLIGKNFCKYLRLQAILLRRGWLQSSMKSVLFLCFYVNVLKAVITVVVERLTFKNLSGVWVHLAVEVDGKKNSDVGHSFDISDRRLYSAVFGSFCSCLQSVRRWPGRLHFKWGTFSSTEDDGWQQPQGPWKNHHVEQMSRNLFNLPQDQQLQQIVDKTIMEADQDGDGKLSFEEFALMVSNTVRHTELSNFISTGLWDLIPRISSNKWH
jgi:hypothetical protein